MASSDEWFPRPYLENILHKKGLVELAQVVECLPSKCEALSSTPKCVLLFSKVTLLLELQK
jgi:hypothetical protein